MSPLEVSMGGPKIWHMGVAVGTSRLLGGVTRPILSSERPSGLPNLVQMGPPFLSGMAEMM